MLYGMPALVTCHLPRGRHLENLDGVRRRRKAVGNDTEEEHPRRGTVERVEVDERVGVDREDLVDAPRQVPSGPVLGGILHLVGRLERGRHPAMEVVRRPDLQAISQYWLPVGATFDGEERKPRLVREPKAAVRVRRWRRPRIDRERLELAALLLVAGPVLPKDAKFVLNQH